MDAQAVDMEVLSINPFWYGGAKAGLPSLLWLF